MKIIGFNGSPRTEGSTAWAINQMLEGAKDCGAETRIFNFGALEIKPCKSCWACKNDQLLNGGKGCVIKDDMQKVSRLTHEKKIKQNKQHNLIGERIPVTNVRAGFLLKRT